MTKNLMVRNVGRLVEVRLVALPSVEAVQALGVSFQPLLRKASGEKEGTVLVCADWRAMRVLAPEVAEAFAESMRSSNSRVLRAAALIGNHATFGLQVERVLRAANNPARRSFREAEELVRWLSEVATPEESERVRQFLLEFEGAPSAESASPSSKGVKATEPQGS